MASEPSPSRLESIYRNRVGQPTTHDEVRGYWVFVIGLILGTAGIAGFLVSSPPGSASMSFRELCIVVGGVGLVMLFAGPVIRLPLQSWANYAAYAGQAIGFLAIVWFVVIYPESWTLDSGYEPVLGLYTSGLLVVAIGGVLAPLLAGTAEDERTPQTATLEADLATARRERDDRTEQRNQARKDADTAEAERADLAADLAALRASLGRFELYEDRSEQWRWRLRHRNGNVIADSGQGYTRKHNAQKGIQSVRSNALGASMLLIDTVDELPDETDPIEMFEETDSQSTIELYEDAASEWRFRIRHSNGEIIGDSGEGYASESNARRAIDRLRSTVGPAAYLWFDPAGFEVYRDGASEWRWRLVHRNGEILADSGQGYSRRNDANRAVDRLREEVEEYDVEVYEDAADEYRWRLEASNGRIVADSGEGYVDRSGAEEAIERVQNYAPDADALQIGQATFEIYEDRGGEHRWRLRHRNGNILLDSGEGYASRSGARDGIESVKRDAPSAAIEQVES